MKAIASWLKVGFYNVVVLLVLLEVASFAASVTGFRGLNHYTSYYLAIVNRFRAEPLVRRGQWYTEFEDWGTWHRENAVTRHSSTCFSATYRSNDYGARDRDRPLQSDDDRIVFLGDSFIEGWGVNAEDRLTDQLEGQLATPVLNFGAAFHTGPLQYDIHYRQIASEFSHNQVIVGLLPANDFTDNDARYWRQERSGEFQTRYRPYYDKTGDPYSALYLVPKPDGVRQMQSNEVEDLTVDGFLYNNTWSYYVFKRLGKLQGDRAIAREYSGYDDAERRQIRPVLSSLEQIQQQAEAQGATLTLVLIPAIDDFARQTPGELLTIQPIFRRFAKQRGIRLIDLLEEMPKVEPDYRSYYHACDRHWSPYGNQVAAEAIAKRLAGD
ncbi:MAG: hypothetical protein WBA10_19630 [Elainellaceae cyanobacterium]